MAGTVASDLWCNYLFRYRLIPYQVSLNNPDHRKAYFKQTSDKNASPVYYAVRIGTCLPSLNMSPPPSTRASEARGHS
jgi:hypothetical protein